MVGTKCASKIRRGSCGRRFFGSKYTWASQPAFDHNIIKALTIELPSRKSCNRLYNTHFKNRCVRHACHYRYRPRRRVKCATVLENGRIVFVIVEVKKKCLRAYWSKKDPIVGSGWTDFPTAYRWWFRFCPDVAIFAMKLYLLSWLKKNPAACVIVFLLS